MSHVRARVAEIAAEFLGKNVDQIDTAVDLTDQGADSLDAVEFIMEIEEEFNIEILDEDAENMMSIDAVAAYIEANQK